MLFMNTRTLKVHKPAYLLNTVKAITIMGDIVTKSAGHNLKNRFLKKWKKSIYPSYFSHSLYKMNEMRKPESTKNMSTPKGPFLKTSKKKLPSVHF